MSTIGSIAPLWDSFPTVFTQEEKAGEAGALFSDIFRDAIKNVRETEDEANKLQYLLSTGQLDNPAELTMSLYKAQASLTLLIQLRNKALDAYNELKNMSV